MGMGLRPPPPPPRSDISSHGGGSRGGSSQGALATSQGGSFVTACHVQPPAGRRGRPPKQKQDDGDNEDQVSAFWTPEDCKCLALAKVEVDLHQAERVSQSSLAAMVTQRELADKYIICIKVSLPSFNKTVDMVQSKVKDMEAIYKGASDLGKCTGFTGFWNLLDAACRGGMAAKDKLRAANKKIPRSRGHWYTEEIHNILERIEARRPANNATVFDMNGPATAFRDVANDAEREGEREGERPQGEEGKEAGDVEGSPPDGQQPLDSATSPDRRGPSLTRTPHVGGGRGRASVFSPSTTGPATGVKRKGGEQPNRTKRLYGMIDDILGGGEGGSGSKVDDAMCSHVANMAAGLTNLAASSTVIQPHMVSALQGMSDVAKAEKMGLILKNMEQLQNQKSNMKPELFDRLMASLENQLGQLA